MAESGDFEMFGAPVAKESNEQSDEQFREEMKRAQKGRQQLKKEEGKARANDDKLAQIIVQFLAQDGNTDLFLLISRCVALNIPSEVIIAVLSLVDRSASEEIENILKETDKNALTVPDHSDIHSLSGGQKQAIDNWLKNITAAAYSKPHRTLESILIKKTAKESTEILREIAGPFVQLSAFIMRNYLAMQSITIDYGKLRDFMQSVYLKMIKDLETMVQGQQKLETSN